MRATIVGYGIQGKKRHRVHGDSCIIVDPAPDLTHIDYPAIEDVPLDQYDIAYVCTPNSIKFPIINYLLQHHKPVLVEKPLWTPDQDELIELQSFADKQETVLYTAYNHRFEPCLLEVRDMLGAKKLGKIYKCRMFYGNGTAENVRNSPWRDGEAGIIGEIGSHLLDMIHFLFGHNSFTKTKIVSARCFENVTPDHVVFNVEYEHMIIQCEMTYLSWKNHFSLEITGEEGSIHAQNFCKWGRSTLTHYKRKSPPSVPDSYHCSWAEPDPTWKIEQDHFAYLCENNLFLTVDHVKDREINFALNSMLTQTKEILA